MTRHRLSARRSSAIALLTMSLMFAAAPAARAQSSLHLLGDLPGGLGSHASAMSADGRVVVGFSYYIASGGLLQSHAFRWTAADGMRPVFDSALDYTSSALAVSADGLSIGGWHAPTIIEEKAFIWSAAGGEQALATRSGVTALSGDGTVGAGYVIHGRGEPPRAAIWINGNQSFIDSPNVIQPGSEAHGISADGTVVVGLAMFSPITAGRAFRWTAATGMQNLGGPLFTDPTSDANAATPDGSVIVGVIGPPPGGTTPTQPARWTAASGWQILGNLPGATGGTAYAVSADGSTVVGASGTRGFIWRAARGMEDLQVVLAPPTGWTITEARAISADGTIIMGTVSIAGVGGGPFIATLPLCRADFNADGTLSSQDFFDFLAAFFTQDARADFNHDGGVNSQDFFDFLGAFFVGC